MSDNCTSISQQKMQPTTDGKNAGKKIESRWIIDDSSEDDASIHESDHEKSSLQPENMEGVDKILSAVSEPSFLKKRSQQEFLAPTVKRDVPKAQQFEKSDFAVSLAKERKVAGTSYSIHEMTYPESRSASIQPAMPQLATDNITGTSGRSKGSRDSKQNDNGQKREAAKEKVKRQRLSGQSGIDDDFRVWRSEEEMKQRQQFD